MLDTCGQHTESADAQTETRIVSLDRAEIDRASQILLRLSGDDGEPSLGELLEAAVAADSTPDLAYVLAGMASSAVSELAGLLSVEESAVVDVLRARLLVVYAREG